MVNDLLYFLDGYSELLVSLSMTGIAQGHQKTDIVLPGVLPLARDFHPMVLFMVNMQACPISTTLTLKAISFEYAYPEFLPAWIQ